MTVLIEDACFTAAAKIRIERAGNLVFRRCSFEGCEIFIADEVDATIFTQCVFCGVSFTGQPLSPRISIACHRGAAHREIAAMPAAIPHARFRR